jgi:hypothetical protein
VRCLESAATNAWFREWRLPRHSSSPAAVPQTTSPPRWTAPPTRGPACRWCHSAACWTRCFWASGRTARRRACSATTSPPAPPSWSPAPTASLLSATRAACPRRGPRSSASTRCAAQPGLAREGGPWRPVCCMCAGPWRPTCGVLALAPCRAGACLTRLAPAAPALPQPTAWAGGPGL